MYYFTDVVLFITKLPLNIGNRHKVTPCEITFILLERSFNSVITYINITYKPPAAGDRLL